MVEIFKDVIGYEGNHTFASLGKKYGVGRTAIYSVVHKEIWNHVK